MKQRGFSLVELAIVLVILGLLAGVVIGAQSMRRQSALQSMVKEQQNYAEAVQLFHDQHQALPGDFPLAVRTWGSTAVDGDGDGRIENQLSDSTNNTAANTESGRFWWHLDLSGFVPSNDDVLVAGAELAVNTSRRSSVGDGMRWVMSGCPLVANGPVNMLGLHDVTLATAVMSSPELLGIDTKIDDGNVSSGRVWGRRRAAGATCVASHLASCTGATDAKICDPYFDMNPRIAD